MTSVGSPTTESVRSFADDLRRRAAGDLTDLLTRRPDLRRPAPADLTSLAARAGTRASVSRALDGLDTGQLQVLEALVVAGDPVDLAVAAGLLGAGVERIVPIVEQLWRLALLWRSTPAPTYHVTRAATEALGPEVAGLAPEDAMPGPRTPLDRSSLDLLLAEAPDSARAILHRLTWGPPRGTVELAGPLGEPVRWLLDAGLVRETGAGSVLLPRSVALRLRGGRLHRHPRLDPPQVPLSPGPVGSAAGAGPACRVLEMVEEIADLWGRQPPRAVRTGGLAVRDLRQVATSLRVGEAEAALLVEVAFAAGLVADDGEVPPSWAPTDRYDAWRDRPAGRRWLELVWAWLRSPRAAFLVGRRVPGPTAARAIDGANALSDAVIWPAIRSVRRTVLDELLDLGAGGHPEQTALRERLRWRRPRLAAGPVADVVDAVLREIEFLGVASGGVPAPPIRDLLAPDRPTTMGAAEPAAETWLGPAATDVVLQADLTAVVPGRLEGELGDCLRASAVPESRGAASVFRFDADSVRRGLDRGWTPERLLDVLTRHARTPVPQPLRYLVSDATRRHGTAVVGAATSYVRSDDPGVIEAILTMPELRTAEWQRLAPTVLVGSLPPGVTLARLRSVGLAPVVDTPGGVLVPPTAPHRVSTPVDAVTDSDLDVPPPQAVADLVAHLRRAESARPVVSPPAPPVYGAAPVRPPGRPLAAAGRDVPHTDPAVTIATLRDASSQGRAVWMGVVDADGRAVPLLFHPSWVEAGRVHGTAEGSPQPRTVAISRIAGVREVDDAD